MLSNANGIKRRMRIGLGALALCLLAPVALAGPQEDTEQAEKEYVRGNLIGALSLWRKAADQGYAPAQARLGDMYDKTDEDKEAVEWYRKAAAQGSAAGEFGLGEMYAKGEGVAKDPAQAYAYISRAAEKDYVPAMLILREAYRSGGLGLSRDDARSAEWDAKVQAIVNRDRPATPPAAAAAGTKKK